jgi:hypothetical protein
MEETGTTVARILSASQTIIASFLMLLAEARAYNLESCFDVLSFH